MKNNAIVFLVLTLAIILLPWSNVVAEVPQLINYQGKLTDGDGNLLEGIQAVSFSLYTAADGGESVWTEVHPTIVVSHGLFNVLLGSVETDTIGEIFREQPDLFLEISVNGVTLSPRQRMASVGYSMSTYGLTVESGRLKDNTGYIMPAGSVISYAGSAAPQGWLLCDGSAVSRESYADLFAVLGTSYGVGDSSVTFNLPDFQGNVPVGRKAADGDFDNLGKTGGAKTHQLTTAELPAHVHSVHPPSTGTSSGGSHSHTVDPPSTNSSTNGNHAHSYWDQGNYPGPNLQHSSSGNFWNNEQEETTSTNGNHSHTVDIGQFNSGITGSHSHTLDIAEFDSGSAGSGQAHSILQPYQVINFIIKY